MIPRSAMTSRDRGLRTKLGKWSSIGVRLAHRRHIYMVVFVKKVRFVLTYHFGMGTRRW